MQWLTRPSEYAPNIGNLHTLRTDKAAYKLNTHYLLHGKFLTNPWQCEHGGCNNDNNDVSQFCKLTN